MPAPDLPDYPLPAGLSDPLLATAVDAALRAGEVQLAHFRNGAVSLGAPLYDLKLETDRRCEEKVMAAIRAAYPDHVILTEESDRHDGAGGFTWVVDPLDGTVNFFHGLPFFCVSVACYRNDGTQMNGLPGEPAVGVVFLPFSRELFIGLPGRGAFLNGRPIRVSGLARPAEAVVTVSFGKTPEAMRRMTRRLDALLPEVRKARCLGAAAAELAYIAAGFLGGFVYEGLKLWDFAAGKIILEEAGGFLEAEETAPGEWRVLAGAPGVRHALRAIG
jgi:fructose-1,6-bisphosphatase/inositol monophosphatase family enzyme